MKCLAAIVPVFFVLSSAAGAQDGEVYKCVDVRHTTYTDTPCLSSSPAAPVQIQKAGRGIVKGKETGSKQPRVAAFPLGATRLAIGMTDTQVLNLPSAGRPTQITRNREAHVWHEQWVYRDRGTGEEKRTMYFENGRLVQTDDAQALPGAQARAAIE